MLKSSNSFLRWKICRVQDCLDRYNAKSQSAIPMSLQTNVSEKDPLIWAIADKLTGFFKSYEYSEVILFLIIGVGDER